MEFHKYKHSRLRRKGPGLWYASPKGGPALRNEPSVVCGVYWNGPRWLRGVTWRS